MKEIIFIHLGQNKNLEFKKVENPFISHKNPSNNNQNKIIKENENEGIKENKILINNNTIENKSFNEINYDSEDQNKESNKIIIPFRKINSSNNRYFRK